MPWKHPLKLRGIANLVLGSLALVGLIVVGVHSSAVITEIKLKDTWTSYAEGPARKAASLTRLRDSVGFDGLIHHFHDFVLRQDRTLIVKVQERLLDMTIALSFYRSFDLSEREGRALDKIEDTFLQYADAIVVAERMASEGYAPMEIRHATRINTDAAVQALAELDVELSGGLKQSEASLEAAIERLLFFGISSTVVVALLLGGVSLVVYWSIHRRVLPSLGQLSKAMKSLATGDVQVQIDGLARKDEIGEMTRALNILKLVSIERWRVKDELEEYRSGLEATVRQRTQELEEQKCRLEEALEKEREYNAMQDQFVAMASHEFRTPLTIIDSAAQRLERRADKLQPGDILQRAQKIRGAVKRMLTLIESVLSSASLDAGKFKVEVQPYDLRALVEQACARQRDISPLHNIVAHLDELPASMTGDPSLLEQVFTNLLSNAVKYAPNDPQILVVGKVEAGKAYVAVKDQGVGIPARELPKLFERFFRASTSTGIAGTGIGLNLVSQIVELHGGRIDVESTEGEGSTFIVQLPVQTQNMVSEAPDQSDRVPEVAPDLRTAS